MLSPTTSRRAPLLDLSERDSWRPSKMAVNTCMTLTLTAATAAIDVAASLAGTVILTLAERDGEYSPHEAASMGAVGGAIVGAGAGLVVSGLHSCGIHVSCKGTIIGVVGTAALNGLVGFSILNATGAATMTIGPVAAVFAVGGAVVGGLAMCFWRFR